MENRGQEARRIWRRGSYFYFILMGVGGEGRRGGRVSLEAFKDVVSEE